MKTMSKKIWTVAAMMLTSVTFIACGGNDDVNSDDIDTVTPPTSTEVTPEQEKEYIESVGIEFVRLFKASDYQDIANIATELEEVDGDGIFEDFIKETKNGNYDKTKLIALANIKGSFVASYKSKKWSRNSTTGDLSMQYTASDGKVWELKESHSGSWGTVTISEDEDWYYDSGYKYYFTTTKTEIPKTVKMALTKGGETVANVDFTINNISFEDERPSLSSKMSYTLTAKVRDFEVTSSATYNPGGSADVKATVKKNGKTILTVDAAGSTIMSKGEINDGSITNINVCVLNKLNAKGSVINIKSLSEALQEADENDENETVFDRWLNNANKYIDLGLYNNNEKKQAEIYLGKDAKRYYSSYYRYKVVPMLKFSDKTTYSFEEYFSEDAFKKLIDEVETTLKEFEKLVD